MRFGISTHLYHEERLSREHLVEIAAHGFEAVELFATRSHFDYHDANAIAALAEWLQDTGLTLHGIHAPIGGALRGGAWSDLFSTATTDRGRRDQTLREAEAALQVARRIPTSFLVAHLGVPGEAVGDNDRAAARQSAEALHGLAGDAGVRLALEVIPNALSTPASLVRLLEEEAELGSTGICLDVGHALLLGDVVEAIETTAEHLLTVHLHDNHGRADDHLVPFEGRIDWSAALMAVQKVGYDGVFLMELGRTAAPPEVLARATRARKRFEEILVGSNVVQAFKAAEGRQA
jgi:sugar phosphate isomerase/epimerase